MRLSIIVGILILIIVACIVCVYLVSALNISIESSNKRNRKKQRLISKKIKDEKNNNYERKGIEKKLYYSGLSRKFSVLTSEWFFIISLIIGLAFAVPVYYLTRHIILGCVAAGIMMSVMYMIVYVIANRQFKKVDSQLIRFANLVDNFSKSNSGDLMSLLRNVSYYLDEPLSSVLKECVDEAAITGDEETAVERLKQKIESPLFSDIITNLTIASRHESNYGEVIEAYRRILREHSMSVQNKKSMITMARTNILTLAVVAVVIITMMKSFVSTGLFEFLTENLIGYVLVGFLAVVLMIIVYIFITIGRNSN